MKKISHLFTRSKIFLYVRVAAFAACWVAFIIISTKQMFKIDDVGAAYWGTGGLYTTPLVAGIYILVDWLARRKRWNEKKLWLFWIAMVVFVIVSSRLWIVLTFIIYSAVGTIVQLLSILIKGIPIGV